MKRRLEGLPVKNGNSQIRIVEDPGPGSDVGEEGRKSLKIDHGPPSLFLPLTSSLQFVPSFL